MNVLIQTVLEEARGAWRFRWIALAAAWAVCLLGWAVVLFLPDTYEASARVFVDTRTALKEVTQGIGVDSDVNTQLQRVRQALLGGPQLEKVVHEANVPLDGITLKERQSAIASLRDRIDISVNKVQENQTGGLYIISYRDNSRDQALRVVDRLVNSFVDSTLGGKREGSEQAQRFLMEQISDYEKRLSAAEERLAEFKKQNVGLMPGAQGDYFQRLQGEMDALSKAQAAVAVADRRRSELQRQLTSEQPLLTGGASFGVPGSTATSGGNDTASRLREAQSRLDELLLRFTDKHPDVIALRGTLEELKARQQSEIEAVRRGDPGAAARVGLTANPVYQSIQLQLHQTEVEIAALRGEISDHQRKMSDLRRLVDTAPEVEAEFKRLNRDYDVTRAQYQALVERLERARISEGAEATGIVDFDIIDPPTASFSPVSPPRSLLVVAVLLGGLAAGGAVAYGLHQWRPVFGSVRQLHEITGISVLGQVGMTWLEKHRAADRRGVLAFSGAAGMLFVLAIVTLLVQSYVAQLLHRWVA